ncbi:valine--tRNA ligase [Puniceicoccales bacterium CK1056]|uniref:Valine--tRNA ligase n=1 Tax=Oceanipulchritudo coccoides TaxID=2706888 RepID=A0A6B2M2Y2_9BACT|nr:valine--tRNA ligase [Oceanipulchritudo coccoides]NDV62766.1 valine--tRNA ligase [Oceanipulchritudo coccoides]
MATIDKAYNAHSVEDRWYKRWEESGAFRGEARDDADPYCIMIPPPNVTGMLHMGHILNNTLQDIFIRRARLEGKAALWFPGTDHAGIATQTRVEKKLREEGLHRRDLGREKFVDEVWKWRDEHGGIILGQLRKLGASCDWDRTSFTLDEHYSKAVLTSFVELYKRGYLYRGLRMSNWCPVSQTALSNEEVIMKPQRGLFYKMRYEIAELPGEYVQISTTRPETIMGDVAVAVHPDDERYAHLVGKHVWRPFPRGKIPIIADEAVEKDFGTGALKVTPAHDPVDFDIGKRHDLPIVDVFNPDGTLNELAGEPFVGMDRFKARKVAAKMLEEQGNLVETEPYENNVGYSERADVPVEPRLTMQWWLRYPKVAEAKQAVLKGHIKFHPKRWEKTYLHWLETMERDKIDWCISRQLWWGHRIPVWYRKGLSRDQLDFENPDHVHVSVEGPSDSENWEQEEDVLDTWASSWLWPFANFGWPDGKGEKARELSYFYPTQTLVTGFDIIFLWVARMVMAGLEFMGDSKESLTDEEIAERIPFSNVYITGLIRDEKGRKMSKSLGNSPDPLDLIKRFGADGMRFGIVNIAPSGQDILFSEDRIEVGRNFCNKLWNAARFRQMSGEIADNSSESAILKRIEPARLSAYDKWILSRLVDVTAEIERCFERYEIHAYPHGLYEFFWSDYCDWYVEASKSRMKDEATKGTVLAVQDLVMRQVLLLLQPIIPFITEELWQGLGYAAAESALLQDSKLLKSSELKNLIEAAAGAFESSSSEEIEAVKELITRIRAMKAEYNVASRRDVPFFILPDKAASEVISGHSETILTLAQIQSLEVVETRPEGMPAGVTHLGTAFLDLAHSIDVAAERERLEKELAKLEKGIKAGEAKLNNPKFVDNAPEAVVAGAKQQLQATKGRFEEIQNLLKNLPMS